MALSKLNLDAFTDGAFVELRDACRAINRVSEHGEQRTDALSSIMSAVANVIASAPRGSSTQQELMDAATELGFEPSYYANSIRVTPGEKLFG